MGEMVIGARRGDLPVVIVRPSIVISTFQDPFPGWIEGIRYLYEYIPLFGKQGDLYCIYTHIYVLADSHKAIFKSSAYLFIINK